MSTDYAKSEALEWRQPELEGPVADLQPDEAVPGSYKRPLTESEIMEELARRNTRKGAAYYPLEGRIAPTKQVDFDLWCLFLITSPEWLRPSSSDKIAKLYDSYLGFARAIGKKNAAVWFWKTRPEVRISEVKDAAKLIDYDRCAAYAATLKLDVSSGPHLVVTATKPSTKMLPADSVTIDLHGLTDVATQELLETLADQMVVGHLDASAIRSEQWWAKWRAITNNVLSKVSGAAKHVTIKFNIGVVEVTAGGANGK